MSKLTLNTIQLGTSGTADNNFVIKQPSTPNGEFYIQRGNDGTASNVIVMDASNNLGVSGNVGIGTNLPFTALDVVSAAASPIISLTATGAWRYQLLTDRSTQTFRIRDQSAGNLDRLIINSSGNLGIGTSSPGYKLDISAPNDATARVRLLTTTGYNILWSSNDSGGTWVGTEGSTGGALMSGTPAWASVITSTVAAPLCFGTNTTERMRLDASGNLLVGTTATGAAGIGISNGANLTFPEGSGASYVNLFRQSNSAATVLANGYKYTSTANGFASSIGALWAKSAVVLDTGSVIFYANGATTVANGTDVTPTERARVTSTGEFLVGTTTATLAKFAVTGMEGTNFNTASFRNNNVDVQSLDIMCGRALLAGNVGGISSTVTMTLRSSGSSAGNLAFATGNDERARFVLSGEYVMGTTNTSLTAGAGFKFVPGTSPYIGIVGAATTDANSGYHLYSTGAGAYRFYVGYNGTIYATSTTISAISDQRHKENIRDLDVGLDAVLALKPRKFDWKAGKGKNIQNDRGFIAQEIEQVFPDLIDEWKDPAPEGEEPYKSVRQDLIPVLVKAIQEQQAIIEDLRTRLTTQESAMADLLARVTQLESNP